MEVLAKEGKDAPGGAALSPGALRRCCMDYPGASPQSGAQGGGAGGGGGGSNGDTVAVVESSSSHRERKLSRGEAGSDSSSKDGSIQSDTSLDSEDSCVSVIFIPHPEGRFGDGSGEAIAAGMKGAASAAEILGKKQRSTSNSSESSDSMTSGRGSPMSPNNRMGSPIKMAAAAAAAAAASGAAAGNGAGVMPKRQSGQLVEAGANGKFAVARAIREEAGDTTTFFVERPLEKIEERGTESEAEEELSPSPSSVKEEAKRDGDDQKIIEEEKKVKPEKEPRESEEKEEGASAPTAEIKRRVSAGPKSFEMEDLPDENPIRCHPAFRAKRPTSRVARSSAGGGGGGSSSRRSRFDYPIVRHHPLFAKQRPIHGSSSSSGGGPSKESSNFSSLLLGENVRVIRRSAAVTSSSLPEQEAPPPSSSSSAPKASARMRSFEIFNPETDDLDSDNESTTSTSSSSSSGQDDDEESSKSSNESVESVVSAMVKEDSSAKESGGEGIVLAGLSSSPHPAVAAHPARPAPLPPPTVVVTQVEDDYPQSDEEQEAPKTEDATAYTEKVKDKETPGEQASVEVVGKKAASGRTKEDTEEKTKRLCKTKSEEEAKDELSRRAEERARILRFLLEENKSLLGNISGGTGVGGVGSSSRRSRAPVGTASSVDSATTTADEKEETDAEAEKQVQPLGEESKTPTQTELSSAKEAEVKSPPPGTQQHPPPPAAAVPPQSSALVVPAPSRPQPHQHRRRLDKSRSISPGRQAATVAATVVRQSSVPSHFDEVYVRPTTEMEIRTRKKLMAASEAAAAASESGGAPAATSAASPSSSSAAAAADGSRKITLAHLDVGGGETTGSRESLASCSTDGGTGGTGTSAGSLSKSKSPSPSRSDVSHISSSGGGTTSSGSGGGDARKKAEPSRSTGAIPKRPQVSRQSSLQSREEALLLAAGGRSKPCSPASSTTPPGSRRRRQLPAIPTDAAAKEAAAKLRRPSLEDLALTESLLPPEPGLLSGDEGPSQSPSAVATAEQQQQQQQFSVSKLVELDPRFDRAGSSPSSGVMAAPAASQSDTESISSFPYR